MPARNSLYSILFFGASLWSSVALAEAKSDSSVLGQLSSASLIKWIVAVVAVLIIIVFFGYLLKKLRLGQGGDGQMRIEAQMALGPKERVVKMQVGKRHILLGVTPSSVNFLMDLTEPEAGAVKPLAPYPNQMAASSYNQADLERSAAEFVTRMQANGAVPTGSLAGGAAPHNVAATNDWQNTPWVADTELVPNSQAASSEPLPTLPDDLAQGVGSDPSRGR